MSASMCVCVAAPLGIQLPVSGLGTTVEDVLAPVTHVGDLDEVPGSCLHLGPALSVVAIWGVNQRT